MSSSARRERVAVGGRRAARAGAGAAPLRRWMMSWAMRSPSCSRGTGRARGRRARGSRRAGRAAAGARAGRCAPTPRAGRAAPGRCGRAAAAHAGDASAGAAASAGSFTSFSQRASRPGNGGRRRSRARLPGHGGGARRTRSSQSARSRSARTEASCSPAGGRVTAVGPRVRAARRAGAPRAGAIVRARSSTGRSGAATLRDGDRSVDVYVHKLRVEARGGAARAGASSTRTSASATASQPEPSHPFHTHGDSVGNRLACAVRCEVAADQRTRRKS